MNEHECVFVEEQEPGGRLVLPPCIVCGLPAMDALAQLRDQHATQICTHGKVFTDHCNECQLLGYCDCEECRADAN